MRTAVCLPGQPREVAQLWRTWIDNLLAVLPEPDVFIHTSQEYPVEQAFFDELTPKSYVVEAQRVFPELEYMLERAHYYSKTHANSFLQEVHGWKRVGELVAAYEEQHGFQYDLIVKTRPDYRWLRPLPFELFALDQLNTLYPYAGQSLSNEFALGPREAMFQYFGLFEWMRTGPGPGYLTASNPRLKYETHGKYTSYTILPTYIVDYCKIPVAEYRLPLCQYCYFRIEHCEQSKSYREIICE